MAEAVQTLFRHMMLALVAVVAAGVGAQAALSLQSAPLRAAKAETALVQSRELPVPAQPSDAIPKSADGHYWANGEVNGRSVRFLVDTGATAVALTPEDAEKLGFRAKDLNYGSSVLTAAGGVRAAPIKIASMSVAGARIDNVDAVVIEKGLDASLLGMSYLGRLTRFEATRTSLVLQP
jgi:aspartyl protease family protein